MISSKIIQITDELLKPFEQKIFTSAEGNNPGGSIKDHMVLHELTELLRVGFLRKGSWVSEVSSGSTAFSLAYYCEHFGLHCHLFVPDKMAEAQRKELESYGARVHAYPLEILFQKHADFLKEHRHCHFFNQLMDEKKSRHYKNLAAHFAKVGPFDLVIGSVGTGHSLRGMAAIHNKAKIMTAEPTLKENCNGVRNVEKKFHDKDPCDVKKFQNRMVLNAIKYFPKDYVETTEGPLKISESFKLVLGAITLLKPETHARSILAIGAKNHFVRNK